VGEGGANGTLGAYHASDLCLRPAVRQASMRAIQQRSVDLHGHWLARSAETAYKSAMPQDNLAKAMGVVFLLRLFGPFLPDVNQGAQPSQLALVLTVSRSGGRNPDDCRWHRLKIRARAVLNGVTLAKAPARVAKRQEVRRPARLTPGSRLHQVDGEHKKVFKAITYDSASSRSSHRPTGQTVDDDRSVDFSRVGRFKIPNREGVSLAGISFLAEAPSDRQSGLKDHNGKS